ncbi:glycosyltransferase family 2 protein [Thiopseudomonas alkaliphila]|uniref:glycosyltransferase family 2 protein n=1 Tax=Thiopseudomonas alkaliphila TaxID=1697053 RepID=UPI002574A692|nr:glycosyltransferase family 2 protein [Thiopseudomonas alkaliphila]MDM1706961.1 glycosyltransferase [Thiopseudomonas alkaliphila]
MGNRPLISVIIPVYNYADKIERAIQSVLTQLTSKHELIVINDGSTDNTEAVLDNLLVTTGNRFQVLHKKNKGLAATRNRGIKAAASNWFVFLDADDEIVSGALKEIELHLEENPESRMIIGGYISVWPNNAKQKESLPKTLPVTALARVKGYLIDKTISLANGATVMHRDLFIKGMYPEHFRNAEDLPVFAQALANYHCTVLKRPLAKIHKHSTSLRHNVEYDRQVGLTLVKELFATKRLPEDCLQLEKAFTGQRALSLFRGYYTAKLYKEARQMYIYAFSVDWKVIFKFSYTRKYIKSLFK